MGTGPGWVESLEGDARAEHPWAGLASISPEMPAAGQGPRGTATARRPQGPPFNETLSQRGGRGKILSGAHTAEGAKRPPGHTLGRFQSKGRGGWAGPCEGIPGCQSLCVTLGETEAAGLLGNNPRVRGGQGGGQSPPLRFTRPLQQSRIPQLWPRLSSLLCGPLEPPPSTSALLPVAWPSPHPQPSHSRSEAAGSGAASFC